MVDKERVIEGREEKVLGSMSFLRLEASKMKQNTILLYSPVRVFTKICIITTSKRVRLTARRRKDSHKCEKIVAGIVRRRAKHMSATRSNFDSFSSSKLPSKSLTHFLNHYYSKQAEYTAMDSARHLPQLDKTQWWEGNKSR